MLSHSVSFFNTEDICTDCKTDEQQFPGYANARAQEEKAVFCGDYNYPGVGLSDADRATMRELIAARKQAAHG